MVTALDRKMRPPGPRKRGLVARVFGQDGYGEKGCFAEVRPGRRSESNAEVEVGFWGRGGMSCECWTAVADEDGEGRRVVWGILRWSPGYGRL